MSRPAPLAALGGMLALVSAMGIGRFVYTPILPPMAEALGLSKSAAGLIAAANFAGYLVGALGTVTTIFVGRQRGAVILALAVGAVAMGGMALVHGMAGFMALRFAGGLASAVVLVVGSGFVLEALAAVGGAEWGALHFAGVGLGIAASAVLVAALQAGGAGWEGLWLGAGLVAAVTAGAAALLLPPSSTPRGVARAAVGADRSIVALSLCNALFGFGYVITATFVVAAVRGTGIAGLETAVWLVVGLSAAPSTWLWNRAGSRFGAVPAYAAACAIEAVGVGIGGVWPGVVGALLASALLGGTFMGITLLSFAAVRELSPGRLQRNSAVIIAAFGAGQILGPVVAGVLLDRTGGFLAPSLAGAAALAVATALASSIRATN